MTLIMDVIEIQVLDIVDQILFDKVILDGIPVVIRGANFGDCLPKWSAKYLSDKLNDTPVKVHVCNDPILDFIKKNFSYETMAFNEFIKRCVDESVGEYLYLRSLGNDKRGRDVANIGLHFPSIAADIDLPSFLPFMINNKENNTNANDFDDNKCQLFSSILRVSSANTVLWTHYDIMDNILYQIKGRKRVTLFPPEDVSHLYLCGDKSGVVDVDLSIDELKLKFPLFLNVRRYETILEEGDALFIPSLWFHNVKSLDFSIAINFFWKDKQISELNFYNQKDVYGNKDLTPASFAFTNLDKAIKHIEKMPKKFQQFYLRIMQNIIQQKFS